MSTRHESRASLSFTLLLTRKKKIKCVIGRPMYYDRRRLHIVSFKDVIQNVHLDDTDEI